MSSTGIATYEDFVKFHGVLLSASGLSQSLHRKLFQKLAAETFDGVCYFQVEPVEDGRKKEAFTYGRWRTEGKRRLLLTAESMIKESDVFLVDHAWTVRLSDAYQQLQEIPCLAERMAALRCVDTDSNSDEASESNDVRRSAKDIVEREFLKARARGSRDGRFHNYRGRLNHMNTPEFVKEFEQERQVQWMDIHQRIKSMIRSVFESAALVHPEMHSPTSSAMYGIDVMLDCRHQPKLLEVTYCPDCTRSMILKPFLGEKSH